jgi:hypothetical protein
MIEPTKWAIVGLTSNCDGSAVARFARLRFHGVGFLGFRCAPPAISAYYFADFLTNETYQ